MRDRDLERIVVPMNALALVSVGDKREPVRCNEGIPPCDVDLNVPPDRTYMPGLKEHTTHLRGAEVLGENTNHVDDGINVRERAEAFVQGLAMVVSDRVGASEFAQ